MLTNKLITNKVLAIIQARIGSTRLPGKIFQEVSGRPMLWHMINRLRYSQEINEIVLAVPDSSPNDKLAEFAHELGIKCFRGSEEDVLSRYYGAAARYQGEIIIRLTSDCPLIDPLIVDNTVKVHLRSGSDYTAVAPDGGFPRGLDTEIFSFQSLRRAYDEAIRDYEREHVTPYFYQHPELFKVNIIEATDKLRRPELRLTVDTEADLTLVREIYQRLYRVNQIFFTEDVIELLDQHPDLIAINAHVQQKELGQ